MGCIASQIVDELSWGDRAWGQLSRKEQGELTRAQVARMMPRLNHVPLLFEHPDQHKAVKVGEIIHNYIGDDGTWKVVLEIDDGTAVGRSILKRVKAHDLTGLSLTHHTTEDRPIEVSLVKEGFRGGTGIECELSSGISHCVDAAAATGCDATDASCDDASHAFQDLHASQLATQASQQAATKGATNEPGDKPGERAGMPSVINASASSMQAPSAVNSLNSINSMNSLNALSSPINSQGSQGHDSVMSSAGTTSPGGPSNSQSASPSSAVGLLQQLNPQQQQQLLHLLTSAGASSSSPMAQPQQAPASESQTSSRGPPDVSELMQTLASSRPWSSSDKKSLIDAFTSLVKSNKKVEAELQIAKKTGVESTALFNNHLDDLLSRLDPNHKPQQSEQMQRIAVDNPHLYMQMQTPAVMRASALLAAGTAGFRSANSYASSNASSCLPAALQSQTYFTNPHQGVESPFASDPDLMTSFIAFKQAVGDSPGPFSSSRQAQPMHMQASAFTHSPAAQAYNPSSYTHSQSSSSESDWMRRNLHPTTAHILESTAHINHGDSIRRSDVQTQSLKRQHFPSPSLDGQ